LPAHRFFAALYDRMLAGTEKAGLSEMRDALLAEASGRTLELGAGTGLNLGHYTAAVTELVVTEPDPFMAQRLRDRLAADPPAESVPFADDSFDTAVGTLVLCSVDDPAAAAREIARVLKPEGRFLYLEHVRDPNEGGLARWQDRLERPWGWVGAGCHPNRDTAATLAAAGFNVEPQRGELPKAPPLVRPLIRGEASLPH
jgi:ubiquinone/menaquinone biosynthesis C-methylase UbiE